MGRAVRIADVAAAAGVSPALVSFALNDRPGVAADTRARILAVAEELGYRPNAAARSLRTGRTATVALLVRNLSNPYFLDVVSGAQAAAAPLGVTVLVVDADYDPDAEREHVRRLAAQRVDALAIAPVGRGDAIALWQELRPDAPTVVVNATAPGLSGVTRVGPDNRAAVHLAVRHVTGLGHSRVAFLVAPRSVMADHDRLQAFAELVDELGFDGRAVETSLALGAVEAATAALLAEAAPPPTAIVTNSDHTAHAVYKAARQAGVRVGRDLAVVGHDDLPTSELLDPPLTTLRLDRRALGAAVLARLVGDTGGDHAQPVTLVPRASTGPPPEVAAPARPAEPSPGPVERSSTP